MHNSFTAVCQFYSRAAEYALANLPLHDEVLKNAVFVNFSSRATAINSQVKYFMSRYIISIIPSYLSLVSCYSSIYRYPSLLYSTPELSELERNILHYQLFRSQTSQSVWQSALLEENGSQYHKMDIIWPHMSSMKYPDVSLMFQKLSEVALLVFTLPHSNAEERVFSMVTKNKPNLDLISNLMAHCLAY